MKVRMTFKTPDIIDDVLDGLNEDERAEAKEAISKFVEYDEYLTVEIDTEKGTCEGVRV